VTIGRPFAVGKFHVTVDQFAAFVRETRYAAGSKCSKWAAGGGPGSWRDPGLVQDGSHPVVCVSFGDAKAYVNWIAKKTGKPYRLLSEAEFEYAARGRTSPGDYPRFWFGNDESDLCRNANGSDQAERNNLPAAKNSAVAPCDDGYVFTSPAGRFTPNGFGLFDMAGNAWQWTADCWHDSYNGAPSDGSAWTTSCDGSIRVVRGGSWRYFPRSLRAAFRFKNADISYFVDLGFRVARTLSP
jgi:formylglycine-generating enzyme required for sulfatase activity